MPVKRILIVDDLEANVELLEGFLAGEGYELLSATGGREALQIIEQENLDLVLLDVLMPEIDGFQVCRQIKFTLNKKELPVIMVTALNAREDKLKGLEAGADDFISKPIDWAELTGRVRSLLRLKEAYDTVHNQLERLNYQLEVARVVQNGLTGTEIPAEIECEAFYYPVEQIGGDLYDIVPLDNKCYGFFIADCSGHGVPAALLMVTVKHIFDLLDKKGKDPALVMTELNRKLWKLFDQQLKDFFATAIYLVVDLDNREISYANGGHTKAVFVRGNMDWDMLERVGSPLGILSDTEYTTGNFTYERGSNLLLYTDGLSENRSPGAYNLPVEEVQELLPQLLKKAENGKSHFYNKMTSAQKAGEELSRDDICYLLISL